MHRWRLPCVYAASGAAILPFFPVPLSSFDLRWALNNTSKYTRNGSETAARKLTTLDWIARHLRGPDYQRARIGAFIQKLRPQSNTSPIRTPCRSLFLHGATRGIDHLPVQTRYVIWPAERSFDPKRLPSSYPALRPRAHATCNAWTIPGGNFIHQNDVTFEMKLVPERIRLERRRLEELYVGCICPWRAIQTARAPPHGFPPATPLQSRHARNLVWYGRCRRRHLMRVLTILVTPARPRPALASKASRRGNPVRTLPTEPLSPAPTEAIYATSTPRRHARLGSRALLFSSKRPRRLSAGRIQSLRRSHTLPHSTSDVREPNSARRFPPPPQAPEHRTSCACMSPAFKMELRLWGPSSVCDDKR